MRKQKRRVVLFIFGTRPEAIKMAPVIRAFTQDHRMSIKTCVTAQHRGMLDQVLAFFEIKPDFDLNLMMPNQSLASLTSKAISGCEKVIEKLRPDILFVQGDTTTAFAAAFAAFQLHVPVGHIEAGLRSGRKDSPFPEEMNRLLISDLATLHFCPLAPEAKSLANEGIRDGVHVVGNTVVDALFLGIKLIQRKGEASFLAKFPGINFNKKLTLVTLHRRESFGKPLENICKAIRILAEEESASEFVYPVHMNPKVRKTVFKNLKGIKNVHLIEPLGYSDFLWLMAKSQLIITDSGGVQEEAPSLGVPVLVAREVTERSEGIAAGCAKLVGSNTKIIVREARKILCEGLSSSFFRKNPYGDGKSARRIVDITHAYLKRHTK